MSTAADGEVRLSLKVVPGSTRTAVVGLHGDRLKLKVAAPPEDGRANEAVRALLAALLGLSLQAVRLVSGASAPQKVVGIRGLSAQAVAAALGLPPP